jgi:hypothetical protein
MVAAAERVKWMAEQSNTLLDADTAPVRTAEGKAASDSASGDGDGDTNTAADTNNAEAFADANTERLAA